MKVDVSIIIVNYNTKELLHDCLDSIYKQTMDISFEVIISDNGSLDGSVEMLRNDFPNVILLENKANLGFGKANNRGAEIATGKYLFLLNSDTILLNNAVKEFYDYAEKQEKLLLGSFLYDIDQNVTVSYGKFATPLIMLKRIIYVTFPFILNLRLKVKPLIITPEEKDVDFICGADLFLEKKLFQELKGFDENIFMYCEDEDLCLRALKKNYKCRVITTPKIIHLEGKSSKISKVKRNIMLKSYKYYFLKNLIKRS